MKKRLFWIGLILSLSFVDLAGQNGSAFGIKLGPTVGIQNWDSGRNSDVLIRYHASAYIETYAPDAKYALFAQTGYHVRGGALRLRGGTFQGQGQNIFTIANNSYPYEFNNLSLAIGAKQRFLTQMGAYYWMFGVRGEYTLSTNLGDYHQENDPLELFNLIHPFPEAVRKINYGIVVGGGVDFMFSELVGGTLELSVSPDFSNQYQSIAFEYFDINLGNTRRIAERNIKNVSIELSLGIRLLRIVEYVDKIY
jgi:hypothetical protein